jgi:O-antigen/teichoic acid export membrane protein
MTAEAKVVSVAAGRLGAVGSPAQWLRKISIVRRLGWGLMDQAVSSLTNVAVSLLLVRELAPAQFGAYGLAYITYGFALSASRGISTEPLMVRFSGTKLAVWRRAVAGCTATALITGLIAGVLALAAAAVLHGTISAAFTALGLTFPGLMLQDSWRYSFFALGRGSQALLNDLIWGATMVPGLIFLREIRHTTVFWVVFVWGATAGIAALAGPLQAKVIPNLMEGLSWIARHRDIGFRFLAEGTVSNAGGQLRGYGVGLFLGLAAVGYIQAVGTLIGPMTIMFQAMSLVLIPEAARVLRRAPARLGLFCVLVSAGLAVIAIAWGAVLLILLPHGLGQLAIGKIWRPSYPVVLPTMAAVLAQAVTTGGFAGLHALGAAQRSLRVMLLGTTAFVGLSVGGAIIWRTDTATIWGTAISGWILCALTWQHFVKAHAEAADPASPASQLAASQFAASEGKVKRRPGRHRRRPAGPLERLRLRS